MIPNLPQHMVEALESPSPFMVGIRRKLWDTEC
jgi:hypothetical protein